MKKNFLILFCFLIAVALVIVGSFYFKGQRKEAEYAPLAVPYIQKVIPEISRWDPQTARGYMSSKFLEKTSSENFDRVIKAFSRLGALQSMAEPHFEEIYTDSRDHQTVLSYTVEAEYANGPAQITISLLDAPDQGDLKIYRFNVASEALAH